MAEEMELHNRVQITEEAMFDYESLFLIPDKKRVCDIASVKEHFDDPEYLAPIMPHLEIEAETEAYIDLTPTLQKQYYFRVKYYDESKDQMLMLFVYKGNREIVQEKEQDVIYQYWILKGICLASDWTIELEESGLIRNWLKRRLIEEENEDDWVWTERIRQRQRQLEIAKEGYSEVEDNMALVKELLDNYRTNKAKITVMDRTADIIMLEKQMDYLDACVKTLDADEQQLFREIYVVGNALRKVGRKYGYSKTGIIYRRDRIIAKLDILFDGKTW